MTDLVIWDEAPMQHHHNMEAVDRTFRDLLNNSDKPFGGLTIVFGGDFRQILPVILKGSRGQTVGACMQASFLWKSITILHLHQNMHLNTTIEAEANFARWQLEVGQGNHTDEEGNIILPGNFKCEENTIDSLISTIYPGISTPNLSYPEQYFSERTILSCLNAEVDSLNAKVLDRLPGDAEVFHSADSIPTSEQSGCYGLTSFSGVVGTSEGTSRPRRWSRIASMDCWQVFHVNMDCFAVALNIGGPHPMVIEHYT